MKTDSHLYQIFRCFPELVFLLAGEPSPGPCTMKSVAIKAISRTMDGLIEPVNADAALKIVEFQMQLDPFIYQRIVVERCCLEMEQHPRKVETLILFGTRSMDPRTEPWKEVVPVIYLDEAMQQLAIQQPDHFLISLFRPLLEPEKTVVEKLAPSDYARLKEVCLGASEPAGLEVIFLDWLLQLFKTKSRTEISQMIAELTPIEETVAGRELIDIGIERGLERGMERGLERGMEQLILKMLTGRFGNISLEIQAGVEALHKDDLTDFGLALLGFTDLAAVESWLRIRLGK